MTIYPTRIESGKGNYILYFVLNERAVRTYPFLPDILPGKEKNKNNGKLSGMPGEEEKSVCHR